MRNQEGENKLGLFQKHNLRVMSLYYQRRQEHLITYKSGGNESQIDYVLRIILEKLRMQKCKVIPIETYLTQHKGKKGFRRGKKRKLKL